jgi:flagellar biosynthetic protein FliO
MIPKKAQRASQLVPVVVLALVVIIGISLMNRSVESRARSGSERPPTQELPVVTTPPPKAPAETAPQQDWLEKREEGLTTSFLKAVLYTVLILAAIILGAFAYRYLRRDRFAQTGSSEIRIIGRRHLNPKQSLAIIRVRNRELLVGITDQSIQLLYDFTANQESWSDRERETSPPGTKS